MPHSPITAGTQVVYQDGIYTVRAVDGNVLELAYHTGDFFRLVHASSVLVCPPPATQTAATLPAPAAGQGAGIRRKRYRQVVVAVTNHDDVAQLYRRSYEAAFESEMARRAVEFFS